VNHSLILLMRQERLLGCLRNCLLVLIITQAGTRLFCLTFLLSLSFIAGGLVLDIFTLSFGM